MRAIMSVEAEGASLLKNLQKEPRAELWQDVEPVAVRGLHDPGRDISRGRLRGSKELFCLLALRFVGAGHRLRQVRPEERRAGDRYADPLRASSALRVSDREMTPAFTGL